MTTTSDPLAPLAFPVLMATLAVAPDGALPPDILDSVVEVILNHGKDFALDESNLIMVAALLHDDTDVSLIADALIVSRILTPF